MSLQPVKLPISLQTQATMHRNHNVTLLHLLFSILSQKYYFLIYKINSFKIFTTTAKNIELNKAGSGYWTVTIQPVG